MYAILITDMINDFVFTRFGNERVQKIIPSILKLKKIAYSKSWKVIYLQDYHKHTDPEIKIWGEHAMEGSKGSEIIADLKPDYGDVTIKKGTYNGFFNTDLDQVLKSSNIDKIIFAGVSTDICILNTAANAFYLGYTIIICRECTESIDEETKEYALEYMKKNYGAEIVDLNYIGVM